MRVQRLLHTLLKEASESIDKRIHRTLLLAIEALSKFRQLSLVAIGRTLKSKAKVKHSIKRMDRLFGNKTLQQCITNYYQGLVNFIIKNNRQPIVIVDWSGLTQCGKYHFINASVPVGGRALPILNMAFPLKKYGSQQAHRKFLKQLKLVLKDSHPIIITDAGFRCPWFKLVKKLGWEFLGRVRNTTQYSEEGSQQWTAVKKLYKKATGKATYLFTGLIAKTNSVECDFYLIKERKKYRVKKNLAGKKIQCSVSKKHAKGASEPWLLVTSLQSDHYSALHIINLYKKRMQIEELFRDLKNTKHGLGLRHIRSYKIDRLNVSLLLGALTAWFLWILGYIAKEQKEHWTMQTNTIRNKNVLSNFYIGWQMIIRDGPTCSKLIFFKAIKQITTPCSLMN